MKNRIALLSLLACLSGCSSDPQVPAPIAQQTLTGGAPAALSQNPSPNSPQDPAPAQQYLFQIDVHLLTVPKGTFSNNETFWRRIDENCVDALTHDVLFKNCVRVGEAPMSELDHLKQYIDPTTPPRQLRVKAAEAAQLELSMKKDLPEQTIFVFDASNHLAGRAYDRCENMINLSFAPAPRKAGAVRLSLCPVVRSVRRHLEYTVTNEEREIQFVSPEMLYDLNLKVDIAPDTFLVVAPSEVGNRPSSVGQAFFMRDGSTEPMEQVLLIIPHPQVVAN